MATQDVLIAGQHGGKYINLVPAAKPIYDSLNEAAKRGSHWARLTVSGLRALTSGRLDKNNIFIRPGPRVLHGAEQFYVMLPGCKATVERQPNDSYRIVDLVLDTGYFELNSQKMAGLYKATKQEAEWTAEHIESGKITQDGSRTLVGISDSRYSSVGEAATDTADFFSKAPGFGGPTFKRFDMHFTPGSGTLGGLKNYRQASNPLANESVYGSAQLLAKTMYRAKNIEGVSWVSEFGGAAVLTQAMKILADQNVTLEGHSAYLYRPNTNVEEAVTWAHKLNMTLDRKFTTTTPWDYMGNRNQVGLIKRRFKKEKDYKLGHVAWDLGYQVAGISASVGIATGAIGFAGVPMGVGAWPVMATIAAALTTTVTGLTTAAGALAVGDSLLEHAAPSFHGKYIGSLK